MNALMNITVRVQSAQAQAQVAALQAEIKALEGQLAKASIASGSMIGRSSMESLAKWGSQMQWAGRQLMTNFTLPLVASGGLVTKWVLENETAMVRLGKVYGSVAGDTSQFYQDQGKLATVMDLLSEKYAVQRKEVTAIAGDWAAAGASGASLATGIETTLKTMVLGELDAAKATESLIAIQAQYGTNATGLIRIIEQLNATENTTGVTFGGLVEGMARSAGAARTAGVDVQHLAAMIAALTPAAGTAANAGNAIKTMVSRIMAPTGDAAEIMGLMGINIEDMSWKSLNGAERVEALAKSFHELEGASDDMVSAQAAQVSATIASRWNINRWDVLMRDVYNSMHRGADVNGYYGKTLDLLSDQAKVSQIAFDELNMVLDSNPAAVKRAGVTIQNSLMKVVAQLMPQILWLVNSVSELAQQFSSLDPGLQKAIIGFLALLAAIGPPMALMGAFAVGVGRVGMMFQSVGGGIKTFVSKFGLVKTAQQEAARSTAKSNASMVASSEAGANGVGVAAASMAGRVKAATASMIADFKLAQRSYLILSEQQVVGSMAFTGAKAAEAAAAAKSAPVIARSELAGAAAVTAARAKIASGALAVQAGYARVASAATTAAAGVATGWGRIAAATSAGVTRTATSAGHLAVALPGAINSGISRATTEYLKFTNLTLPIAMEKAVDAVTVSAYRGFGTMHGVMSRSLMENMAILNSYVNGAAAVGARGVTQMGTAMTGAAVATKGLAGKAGAGVAAATSVGLLATLKGLGPKVAAFFKGIGPKIAIAVRAFGPMIGRAMIGALRFLTGPWGLAITAVIGLITIFKDQIGQVFKGIGAQFKDATTPFGQAWAGVVKLFDKGTSYVTSAFRRLPEGIQGSLQAVVSMVRQAAMKVYELFSYLNPFAHHSPSLVENVTRGMDVVGDQFGLAADRIKKYAMSAYQSLKVFGSATANFMAKYEAMLAAEDRGLVLEFVPEAIREYDNLLAALAPLKSELANVGSALDAQQSIVDGLASAVDQAEARVNELQASMDVLQATASKVGNALQTAQDALAYYADAPIAGMRAMSDAMFENEMQQKQLQLALMDWEDVNGSIDDITGRMANLQGSIEMLRGEANDLRSAGAGSDVLGPINAQIAEMEAAYAAMQQGVANSPVDQMQKELEALQRQGQRLDLENSLSFDPLTRQVEQLSTAYKELSFNEIIAGVTAQRAAVDQLQAEYDTANDAVNRHQASLDAANVEAAAARAAYDIQAQALQNLQTVYNALDAEIQAIEESIRSVIDAAMAMQQALESAKSAGGGGGGLSPAGEGFLGAAGGAYADVGDAFTVGDEGGDLQTWIDEFMAGNSSIFESFDMFGGIKQKWSEFTGWWSSNVTPIFSNLGAGLAEIGAGIDWSPITAGWDKLTALFGPQFSKIWDEIKKHLGIAISEIKGQLENFAPAIEGAKTIIGGLGTAFSWVWTNVLEPFVKFLGGAFLATFSVVFAMIGNIVGPVIGFIGDVIGAVIQIFAGLIEFVAGVFTGDWSRAWSGIMTIIGAIWSVIISIFTTSWDIIYGLVKGLVEGILDFFSWLFTGSTMSIGDLVRAIGDFFINMYHGVTGTVGNLVNGVVDWFKKLPGWIMEGIGNLASLLVEKGSGLVNGLWDGAKNIWNSVSDWFKNLGGNIKDSIGDMAKTLYSAGTDIIQGFLDGLNKKYKEVKDMIGGIGDWIADHKGPKSYDLGLLVPAGGWIMEGFGNGLNREFENVKKDVENMAPLLASAFDIPYGDVSSSLNTATKRLTSTTSSSVTAHNETNNFNFYGDLSFPGVMTGDDAGTFIQNLSDLAGK